MNVKTLLLGPYENRFISIDTPLVLKIFSQGWGGTHTRGKLDHYNLPLQLGHSDSWLENAQINHFGWSLWTTIN